jgi:hypothetical protein
MPRPLLLLALVLAAALAAAAPAAAYPWPVKPFDRQHPIRGYFGDPRTLFDLTLNEDGIDGPGSFTFHNGVDVTAPNGTKVYPVVSGTAHLIDGSAVLVQTLDDRKFQYYHVVPAIVEGQQVTAGRTVLGRIQAPFGHVHLSEIDGTRITDPLLPGHLGPYRDHTRPAVGAIDLRDAAGTTVGPLGVCGVISVDASAFDRPALPVVGTFSGLPVAPALVTWQLARVHHGVVVPHTIAADFRTTLPARDDFWNVYARGTYENAPRFGRQQFTSLPGRFLYVLARGFDTRKLANGLYALTVAATDERGNRGTAVERFWIANRRKSPAGCPVKSRPPAPPPATTTPTTTTTTTSPAPSP